MIQVSEERVEQHFPTTVLVRTFQAVNGLNTALQQRFDQLEHDPHADYTNEAPLSVNTTQGGLSDQTRLKRFRIRLSRDPAATTRDCYALH